MNPPNERFHALVLRCNRENVIFPAYRGIQEAVEYSAIYGQSNIAPYEGEHMLNSRRLSLSWIAVLAVVTISAAALSVAAAEAWWPEREAFK